MNDKLREYERKVSELAAGRADLPYLERDSREGIAAWRDYFEHHIGAVPLAFRRMIEGSFRSFTVPAERPEEFDLTYVPPDAVKRR
jgi:hypothetical protein